MWVILISVRGVLIPNVPFDKCPVYRGVFRLDYTMCVVIIWITSTDLFRAESQVQLV